MSSKATKILVVVGILLTLGAVSYSLLGEEWRTIYDKYLPCRRVIEYSLGSFDTRFGVSKNDFLAQVKEAESIWEEPVAKNFFQYNENGAHTLKINLVYDYRQEATEEISDLGLTVTETRASYDSLKQKYDLLLREHSENKKEYAAAVAEFQAKQESYNSKVESWNKKGGAPANVYRELELEGEELEADLAEIRKMESSLNKEAGEINALVIVLNRLAAKLNINVTLINTVGAERGEEFTEGEYVRDRSGANINIYEFSTKDKLRRLLAHEFGHALGLDHLEDPEAIMYRLNQSLHDVLTQADLGSLRAHCSLK